METTIYWHTKDPDQIKRVREHFKLPNAMTVNGETTADIKDEDLGSLKEEERKGLINIRNKNELLPAIKAIQVLQGNAPERILEARFKEVREQHTETSEYLIECINDDETGKTYNNIRMMSNAISAKQVIYDVAKSFASDIKKSLSSTSLSKYADELLKADNLSLGKTPTIEEAILLFSKRYILPEEVISAVFENESSGKYEMAQPHIEYGISKENNTRLISAGYTPYSPNYKELFENLGLKDEFYEFEKSCVQRKSWEDRLIYAIACRDIAEIYDIERELPKLDQKVEESRKALFNRLNGGKYTEPLIKEEKPRNENH